MLLQLSAHVALLAAVGYTTMAVRRSIRQARAGQQLSCGGCGATSPPIQKFICDSCGRDVRDCGLIRKHRRSILIDVAFVAPLFIIASMFAMVGLAGLLPIEHTQQTESDYVSPDFSDLLFIETDTVKIDGETTRGLLRASTVSYADPPRAASIEYDFQTGAWTCVDLTTGEVISDPKNRALAIERWISILQPTQNVAEVKTAAATMSSYIDWGRATLTADPAFDETIRRGTKFTSVSSGVTSNGAVGPSRSSISVLIVGFSIAWCILLTAALRRGWRIPRANQHTALIPSRARPFDMKAAEPTCAACNYALSGIESMNCPECGVDIRVGGVRPAGYRQHRLRNTVGRVFAFTIGAGLACTMLCFIASNQTPIVLDARSNDAMSGPASRRYATVVVNRWVSAVPRDHVQMMTAHASIENLGPQGGTLARGSTNVFEVDAAREKFSYVDAAGRRVGGDRVATIGHVAQWIAAVVGADPADRAIRCEAARVAIELRRPVFMRNDDTYRSRSRSGGGATTLSAKGFGNVSSTSATSSKRHGALVALMPVACVIVVIVGARHLLLRH